MQCISWHCTTRSTIFVTAGSGAAESTNFKWLRLRPLHRPENIDSDSNFASTPAQQWAFHSKNEQYDITMPLISFFHCNQTGDVVVQHTFALTAEASSRGYRGFTWMWSVSHSLNLLTIVVPVSEENLSESVRCPGSMEISVQNLSEVVVCPKIFRMLPADITWFIPIWQSLYGTSFMFC